MTIASSADEILVYNMYSGETLLVSRKGTAEVIDQVRATLEPLAVGLHATLGSGSAKDATVAFGVSAHDQDLDPTVRASLAAAKEVTALVLKVARDNLELAAFSRTILAETAGQIFSAREEARQEEAARWRSLLQQVQSEQKQPIISDSAAAQFGSAVTNVLSFLREKKDKADG